MDFPDRDVALKWIGMTVVDRDGAEIGSCTAVFHDDATLLTEWVRAERSGAEAVFLPAVGASEVAGTVRVNVLRDDVNSAPAVGGPKHISAEEEAALYRHYGIPHSRDASETVLPVEGDTFAGDDALSGAPAFSGTSTDMGSGVPADVTSGTSAGIADTYADSRDTAPKTDSVTLTGPSTDEYTDSAAPSGGRRKVAVAGGLAALGSLGAFVGTRLVRRRRQPTRKERLVQRGRATVDAVGTGAGRLAAPAAPLLGIVQRTVLGHPRVSAAATTAALSAAAVRRRRGRQPDTAVPPPSAVPVEAVGDLRTSEESRAAVRRWRRNRQQPGA